MHLICKQRSNWDGTCVQNVLKISLTPSTFAPATIKPSLKVCKNAKMSLCFAFAVLRNLTIYSVNAHGFVFPYWQHFCPRLGAQSTKI